MMSNFSLRTSTILPLPSSPHWAPRMTADCFLFTRSVLSEGLVRSEKRPRPCFILLHLPPINVLSYRDRPVARSFVRGRERSASGIVDCGKAPTKRPANPEEDRVKALAKCNTGRVSRATESSALPGRARDRRNARGGGDRTPEHQLRPIAKKLRDTGSTGKRYGQSWDQ